MSGDTDESKVKKELDKYKAETDKKIAVLTDKVDQLSFQQDKDKSDQTNQTNQSCQTDGGLFKHPWH